jgi:hypothetical protein
MTRTLPIPKLSTPDDDKFFDLGLQAAECELAAENPNLSFQRRQTLLDRAAFYRNEQLFMVVAGMDAEED